MNVLCVCVLGVGMMVSRAEKKCLNVFQMSGKGSLEGDPSLHGQVELWFGMVETLPSVISCEPSGDCPESEGGTMSF